MNGKYIEWPYYIDAVQYYYNCKIHELSNSTPFSLLLARQANAFGNYTTARYKPITLQEWYEHQQQVVSII